MREWGEQQHQRTSPHRDIVLGLQYYIKSIVLPNVNIKLYLKCEGPYRIMKDLRKNRFEILDLRDLNKTKIIHADYLKIIPNHAFLVMYAPEHD